MKERNQTIKKGNSRNYSNFLSELTENSKRIQNFLIENFSRFNTSDACNLLELLKSNKDKFFVVNSQTKTYSVRTVNGFVTKDLLKEKTIYSIKIVDDYTVRNLLSENSIRNLINYIYSDLDADPKNRIVFSYLNNSNGFISTLVINHDYNTSCNSSIKELNNQKQECYLKRQEEIIKKYLLKSYNPFEL